MRTLTRHSSHFIAWSAAFWNRWIRLSCYYNRKCILCL